MGDIAGLSVALGTMGGVIGMTKDAVAPMFGQREQMAPAPAAPAAPTAPTADSWDCSCGVKGLTGKFCPEYGACEQ